MLDPLFAETDWVTIFSSVGGAMATMVAGVGASLKLFLIHLEKRSELQRKHESEIMTRVEGITTKFDATVRDVVAAQRTESRETIQTLLKIQGETVEAVGKLGEDVRHLGAAITELRREVAMKADREDAARTSDNKKSSRQSKKDE